MKGRDHIIPRNLEKKKKQVIGNRYGRWTIGKYIGGIKQKIRFEAVCDCGTKRPVLICVILAGNSQSCGCYKSEKNRMRLTIYPKEVKDTPEFRSYCCMRARCYHKGNTGYKWYGLKGIKVCKRWLKSFYLFLEDMGKMPEGKSTLERNDIRGDYSKENCKWASRYEQAQNRSTTVYLTINGIEKKLQEWAKISGVSAQTVRKRFKKKYTPEQILFKGKIPRNELFATK